MKIQISPNGRHFSTEDGTPFFWLADTAWNAPLRGDTADWIRYLDLRKQQGFTAIQFVTGPWRGCRTPVHGRLFEQKDNAPVFDEGAFTKMDEWFTLITERGMIPVPVMIWDNNPDDAFFKWNEQTCIETGEAMLSRWSSYNPVWFLAGDGDYRSSLQADRWKRIGQRIFKDSPDSIATMHPCGCSWVGDIFRDEPWYSFVGIQSGHGTVHYDLGFLLNGQYASRWNSIEKPFLNIEANYEFASSYVERIRLDDYYVRRASYWSLLSAPPAGITYGSNSIWVWAQEDNEYAEGHGKDWAASHWESGLETPGIQSLKILKSVFTEFPWTQIKPADYLLAEQPGWADPNLYIKVSSIQDRSFIIAYLPRGGTIRFTAQVSLDNAQSSWINPRTGERISCSPLDSHKAEAPTEEDWLLEIRADEGPKTESSSG